VRLGDIDRETAEVPLFSLCFLLFCGGGPARAVAEGGGRAGGGERSGTRLAAGQTGNSTNGTNGGGRRARAPRFNGGPPD